MFLNEENTVIYTGPVIADGEYLHQFDLFVDYEKFLEITKWASEQSCTWYLYKPMDPDEEKRWTFTKELWDREEEGSLWLWFFIKEEDKAMHFRLSWEQTTDLS